MRKSYSKKSGSTSQSKGSSKDKYLDSLKKRYAKANKKERGQILDEYVQTTGYHRKHAITILSGQYQPAQRPIRRPRKSLYIVEDAKALDFLSDLFDGINAKRLRAAMDAELDMLYRRGVLKVSRACYRRLKRISPASMDRLRVRYGQPRPKSRHRTKPGTLLKSQIPIRTWADWNEDRLGFVEMDLVGHDGGDLHGDYCLTLDFTDVKTGWTSTRGSPRGNQIVGKPQDELSRTHCGNTHQCLDKIVIAIDQAVIHPSMWF
jgi:hypothetical protein